jgi:uncharacterized phage-associated protein
MLKAIDIARYILAMSNDGESGELISNLKIQKLLYYAQGYYLALTDQPLFNEKIEAWAHGPVIPSIYRDYSMHGANPIEVPDDIDFTIYTHEVKDFLGEVYQELGQYSAWKLRNMTHEEAPWLEAVKKSDNTISHESMKKFFSQLINKNV